MGLFVTELTDVAHTLIEIYYIILIYTHICVFFLQGKVIVNINHETALLSNQVYINNSAEQMCDVYTLDSEMVSSVQVKLELHLQTTKLFHFKCHLKSCIPLPNVKHLYIITIYTDKHTH